MNKKSVEAAQDESQNTSRRLPHIPLFVYDLLMLFVSDVVMLTFGPSTKEEFAHISTLIHFVLAAICIGIFRWGGGVYRQIWRYGSSFAYIKMMVCDFVAGALYFALVAILPVDKISFIRAFSIITLNLLLAIGIRLLYQFFYEYANKMSNKNTFLRGVLKIFAGLSFEDTPSGAVSSRHQSQIRIAIVGAGRVGAMLADELLKNPRSAYVPCCFVDTDHSKIGREIFGLPVISGDKNALDKLKTFAVQEIVFALPSTDTDKVKELYDFYKQTGCTVKVYDYPIMQAADKGKRKMREFDVEELLFRKSVQVNDEKTSAYYKDKVILITGGGGSIGSELCRQIARMQPRSLIILDVYENGAYDIQQELRMAYGSELDVHVEILSVCDKESLEKVFAEYRPNVVLHAAAHKHVPLMEHNCCEAVKNNVFGTLNTVELSEKYGVERFMMVSTDKAVNPTNVMGATKRLCEMIVQSHSQTGSKTTFSATRFGNVLGSAASVVPLFKKQIKNGGPVTVTDKRIIRYFMTIPEASQLVLQSASMAKNGELFVLDMGKSIRILDLAETMIRLSGYEPYRDIDIVEVGLRPGEKLYEELLIRTEELEKTDNKMIFIERDAPLPEAEIAGKLDVLRAALAGGDDLAVKAALMSVVPTYSTPEDVNSAAIADNKLEKMYKPPEVTSVVI